MPRIWCSFEDSEPDIQKVDEKRTLGGPWVAVCRFKDLALNITSRKIVFWGILRLPCAVLRIRLRFKDPGANAEKIKENRFMGDPPVAVRRFKDPVPF